MGLFNNKNPNESAFAGGKKHWADVIKNTGSGKHLIWRQPEEDFNTNSTLIVMPGEEAIFINGGTVEQVFDNGTYKLSTQNYPFISRLRNAFTGGISTFNCVVYFVRKADTVEIKWGTDSPIQLRDKIHGIRTSARVRGAYKVRISNPVMFLEKLIGSNVPSQLQNDLPKYFQCEFQGKIKSEVTKFLNDLEQELIGIDAYIEELSDKLLPKIDETVSCYGLTCTSFSLAAIDVDISKYDEIDQHHIASIGKVKNAQGDRAVMDILGDKWEQQQQVDILKTVANNPSNADISSSAAGLGMGMAVGGLFGTMAQGFFNPANNVSPTPTATPDPAPPQPEDPVATLTKLKQLLDAGLIEQEEFDNKKAEILSRM